MGFDISKFIEKVEAFAQTLPGGVNSKADKQLDAFEKASLFNNTELRAELESAYDKGEISAEDVKNIFGLELSNTSSSHGRRKAAGEGDGDNSMNLEDGAHVTVVVEAGGTLNLIIDNSSNWQLTVNFDVLDNNTDNIADIIAKLVQEFTNSFQNISQDMVNQLKEFLKAENNNLFTFLYGIAEQLINQNGLQLEAMQQIIKALENIGIKIDNVADVIKSSVVKELQTIQNLLKNQFNVQNDNMNKLIALVEKNNSTTEEQNDVLTKIYDAIKNITGSIDTLVNANNEQVKQLVAILDMLNVTDEHQQEAYEKVIKLLEGIRNDNSENKDILNQILDAIKEGNEALALALSEISTKFTSYGDDIKALLAKILEKEYPNSPDPGNPNPVDLTALLDRLDKILTKLDNIDNNTSQTAQNTTEINKTNKKILQFVEKYGTDYLEKFDALIALGQENNQYQADIKALIEQLIEHGIDFKLSEEDLNRIIEAIGWVQQQISSGDASLYSALMSIKSLIVTTNENIGVITGGHIIEVKDEHGRVTGYEFDANGEGYIQKFDKYLTTIIELLGKDPENGQNYSQILQDILDALGKLDDIDDHMNNNFLAILAAIENKANEGFDGSTIEQLLADILEAIKNHKVLVEVHSDGSCNITTDPSHEGAQDDLTGPLGARMKALANVLSVGGTYEDPDAVGKVQSEAGQKDGKYMIDGKVVIIKDGKAYDTLGRPIK